MKTLIIGSGIIGMAMGMSLGYLKTHGHNWNEIWLLGLLAGLVLIVLILFAFRVMEMRYLRELHHELKDVKQDHYFMDSLLNPSKNVQAWIKAFSNTKTNAQTGQGRNILTTRIRDVLEAIDKISNVTLELQDKLKTRVQTGFQNVEKAHRINKNISRLTQLISGDSRKVTADTQQASQVAIGGIKSIGSEIQTMSDLKSTLGSSAQVIQQLNATSDQIGEFVSTISTITRKTNLLALNAGIEATRAGVDGQGFAVVANEIKILAEASAQASSDVRQLVEDIQQKTKSAVSLILSTEKLEENIKVVFNVGDIYLSIAKSIKKAVEVLGEISDALDEQKSNQELLSQLMETSVNQGLEIQNDMHEIQEKYQNFSSQLETLKSILTELEVN
jgi:methyl-accepting chemotaxis protein